MTGSFDRPREAEVWQSVYHRIKSTVVASSNRFAKPVSGYFHPTVGAGEDSGQVATYVDPDHHREE
jgi:hypothetical protein